MAFFRFKTPTNATLCRIAAILFIGAFSHASYGQSYPAAPIKMIIGFAPGGATDSVARVMARALEVELGQPVVVDNRPGAGTIIATEATLRSKPDGYTLMLHAPEISTVPALKKQPPWNVATDFTPIALVARTSLVYLVNASVPAKTLQEFVSYAKSKPGALNFGSSGAGSILHLGALELLTEAGLSMTHIPYNGGAPLMQALMGGQIELAVLTPINAPPSDRLRLLAQTGNARHPLLPNVPTTKEAGLPTVNQTLTFSLVGPKNLPPEVVTRIQTALQKISTVASYRSAMVTAGAEADFLIGNELAKTLTDAFLLTQRFVKIANIPLD